MAYPFAFADSLIMLSFIFSTLRTFLSSLLSAFIIPFAIMAEVLFVCLSSKCAAVREALIFCNNFQEAAGPFWIFFYANTADHVRPTY